MAGLLAGAMLRAPVIERAPKIPNNHSAVLRFRSSTVSSTLSIPFRKVTAVKSVEPWRNPIADAISYSLKTNGTATLRSVLTADATPQTRWIAPPDLIQRMVNLLPSYPHLGEEFNGWKGEDRPIISTIPMPTLMAALGYEHGETFRQRAGVNISADLKGVDAYCSLYVPDPSYPGARISLTGSKLIVECYQNVQDWEVMEVVEGALDRLGIRYPSHVIGLSAEKASQKYAKILPIDEDVRKHFLMWATDNFGIYSLGRFATWRPGLLLDDVVNDVFVIQRLIENKGERYAHRAKG